MTPQEHYSMLDWSKIDDDKVFQRLINHLFALECNSPGFVPSSPYIGADGGWDGYYDGYNPYENLRGTFSIQSKWTTKSYDDAEKHLKKEVRKELTKAKANNVQHLRIATNAELRVNQILKLKSLNSGEVLTLDIWHRENLTLRIENQPFLRQYFFEKLLHPEFVPANTYFGSNIEPHLTDFSGTVIGSFAQYYKEFEKFALSDKEKIFIVHASGGYGKTHFIKELAELVHRIDSNRQPWFAKLGMKKIQDAIQQEIMPNRKYLLVIDDADKDLDEIKPILAYIRKRVIDLKVVLSLRSAGIYMLMDMISDYGLGPSTTQIQIRNWKQEELIKLLRLSVQHDPNKIVRDEDLIVNTYPNPYLIVELSKHIRGEGYESIDTLKTKFVDDITTDSKKALHDSCHAQDIEMLISALSSVVPFHAENEILISKVHEEFKLDRKKFKEVLKRLIESGILREVGHKIRFNPDMKGDFYLQNHIEIAKLDEIKSFILTWMEVDSLNVYLNIGSASRYGETAKIKTILSEIVNEWVADAEDETKESKARILSYLEKITFIVPEESVRLLSVYLEIDEERMKVEVSPNKKITSLTTDAYGNVLLELKKIPSIRNDLLNIIEKITKLEITGIYYNYKPSTLIAKCVSPIENKLEIILSTIEIFDHWLVKPTEERIILLEAALGELFRGANNYERYKMGTLELGSIPLRNDPRVIALRDAALWILKKMLGNETINAQCAAVRIAAEIGQDPMGRDGDEKLPLHERFAEERKQVIHELQSLLKSGVDYRLVYEIENLCLMWWALKKEGATEASKVLSEVPKNPEYLIYKYSVAKYFVADFAELERDAPEDNRWSWFINQSFNYESINKIESINATIAAELNNKYNNPNQICNFLRDLDHILPNEDEQGVAKSQHLIRHWILVNPAAFMKIRDESDIWKDIPHRYKNEIDASISLVNREHVYRLADEIFESVRDVPSEKLLTFLRIVVSTQPDSQTIEYLKKLAKIGNPFIKANIIFNLKPIFDKTKNFDGILDIIVDVISDQDELGDLLIQYLAHVLREFAEEFKKADQRKISDIRGQLLKCLENKSKFDYYSNQLLSSCVDDLDDLLKFIDRRLKVAKTLPYSSGFQPIPYEGIDLINEKISNYFNQFKIKGII